MAKIRIEDLVEMSNQDVRNFLLGKKVDLLPEKLKKYLDIDSDREFELYGRINRVNSLLNLLIIERFLKKEL